MRSGVIVFDSTGTEVTRISFGAATTGSTFYWSYDAAGTLATAAGGQATVDVAAFKDRYGISRKFAIPLLEYLDRERVTRRTGDVRLVI